MLRPAQLHRGPVFRIYNLKKDHTPNLARATFTSDRSLPVARRRVPVYDRKAVYDAKSCTVPEVQAQVPALDGFLW